MVAAVWRTPAATLRRGWRGARVADRELDELERVLFVEAVENSAEELVLDTSDPLLPRVLNHRNPAVEELALAAGQRFVFRPQNRASSAKLVNRLPSGVI